MSGDRPHPGGPPPPPGQPSLPPPPPFRPGAGPPPPPPPMMMMNPHPGGRGGGGGWAGGPPPPPYGGPPPGFYPPPPPQQAPRPLWTEHRGKDGRTYWYNRETKKSSWEKPEELGGAGPAAAAAATTPWREVKAPDGRPYFYNRDTKTSVWVCPPELVAAREAAARASGGGGVPGGPPGRTAAPPPAPQPAGLPGAAAAAARAAAAAKDGKFMYATKAEAKAAFCELLQAAGAKSTDAWDAVAPTISADPRWAALKSAGERRACFTEYRAAAAKREAIAAREARGAAREAFAELLASSGLDPASARFVEAEGFLGPDPRWSALDKAAATMPGPTSTPAAVRREKEDLFEEWRRGAERAAREAARAAREAVVEGVAGWVERRGWVGAETRWRDAEERLAAEAEGEGTSNPYASADALTRLAGFSKALRRLWSAADEESEKVKTARGRSERRARDAFRSVLAAHAEAGLLAPRSRWREYRARLRGGGFGGGVVGDGAGAAALEALEAPDAGGARPRDLFEDALADVEDRFAVQRAALLTAAVKGAGLTVSQGVADGSAPGAAADLATLRLAFDDAADAAGGTAAEAGGGVRDLVWAEVVGCAAAGEVPAFGDEANAEADARGWGRTRSRSPARRGDSRDGGRRRRRGGGGRESSDEGDRAHHHRHRRRRREEEEGQEEGEL